MAQSPNRGVKRPTTAPRTVPRRTPGQLANLRAFNGGNKRVAARGTTRRAR